MKLNLRLFTALACAAVMAASYAQGQGGGRGGRQGRIGRNATLTISSIIQRADVQADLKVTDDEKTKIEALRPQRGQRGAGGGGGNGGAGGGGGNGGAGGGQRTAPDPAAMAARRAEEKKAIEAILTPDQMKRLGEILIQMQGDQAVADPDVQTAINFTDDQKAKLKDLTTKYREATRSLMEKVRSQELDQAAAREAMTTNQKALTDEIHKILTPEQVEKLKTMGGAPFKREDPPRRGGGN